MNPQIISLFLAKNYEYDMYSVSVAFSIFPCIKREQLV